MKECIKYLEKIGTKRLYEKGSIIFFEGENAQKFFLLLKGVVRVYKSISINKELNLHYFKAFDFIAEMPAFKKDSYPANAVCEQDCELLELDFDTFEQSCLKDGKIALMMINSLFAKIMILKKELLRGSMELRKRFIFFILENESNLDQLSQRQIAILLNARAESLSRIIKEFKVKQLISTQKGKIKLENKQALQNELW